MGRRNANAGLWIVHVDPRDASSVQTTQCALADFRILVTLHSAFADKSTPVHATLHSAFVGSMSVLMQTAVSAVPVDNRTAAAI